MVGRQKLFLETYHAYVSSNPALWKEENMQEMGVNSSY